MKNEELVKLVQVYRFKVDNYKEDDGVLLDVIEKHFESKLGELDAYHVMNFVCSTSTDTVEIINHIKEILNVSRETI